MADFLYAQRPSKHVQRRIVVDACRKLRAFAPLHEYEYVGFGAYEFVDFELFRRELGIVKMESIEADTNAQDRYLFNRPFADIKVHFDRASNVLPDLLDRPALRIVWLDYTCGLNQEVLQDIGTCVRELSAGSVLLITVAARPARPASERLASLIDAVGRDRVSADVTNDSLAQGLPRAQREIMLAEAEAHAARRNDGATFGQLFNLKYRDDQPMQTWGGILVAPAMRAAFESARFDELDQVCAGPQIFDATVQPLTTREVLHLNPQLPLSAGASLAAHGIPEGALLAYERLYRYYPVVPAAM